MKRRHRTFEIFNLSFLDVVSCGFGAIVLLLVIVKISEPEVIEQTTADLDTNIQKLRQENQILQENAKPYVREIHTAEIRKKESTELLAKLNIKYALLKEKQNAALTIKASQESILNQFYLARQELSDEMRRLQATQPPKRSDSVIGGVPVDSEYIIFVIDTSGSMQEYAWTAVRRKMEEVLTIYPRVKGVQVLNDMGDYMFSQYTGRWIPDSPARRKAILKRLHSWRPFSNSSPAEGITAAIRRFYKTDKKMSIYIFGDDFSRGSIQEVVDIVDSSNQSLKDGSRRVRIHAVGFPVLFDQPNTELNVARFAALMRRLAEDNNGSFVGLTRLR